MSKQILPGVRALKKANLSEKQLEYALMVHAHNNKAVVAPSVTVSIIPGGYDEDTAVPGAIVFNEKKWTLLGSVHWNGEYFSSSVNFDTYEEAKDATPAMEQMLRLRMRNLGGQEP